MCVCTCTQGSTALYKCAAKAQCPGSCSWICVRVCPYTASHEHTCVHVWLGLAMDTCAYMCVLMDMAVKLSVCVSVCLGLSLCVCEHAQVPEGPRGVGGTHHVCGAALGCGSLGSPFKSGTELGRSWRETAY